MSYKWQSNESPNLWYRLICNIVLLTLLVVNTVRLIDFQSLNKSVFQFSYGMKLISMLQNNKLNRGCFIIEIN